MTVLGHTKLPTIPEDMNTSSKTSRMGGEKCPFHAQARLTDTRDAREPHLWPRKPMQCDFPGGTDPLTTLPEFEIASMKGGFLVRWQHSRQGHDSYRKFQDEIGNHRG